MSDNIMRWIPIDGKNFPLTTKPDFDGCYWEEWRGLLWADDPHYPGVHLGRMLRYADGHVAWLLDGTNSEFSISHYCEIINPFVYKLVNDRLQRMAIAEADSCEEALSLYACEHHTNNHALLAIGWTVERINR